MRRRAILTYIVLLAVCPCAFALNPALDVSQYAHASWRDSDGFAKGYIAGFAQTSDGYLWLATEFGLLRFDGVKPVPWEPPQDQPRLPSNDVRKLLAARDGTLWIGTREGLASWKNGKLTLYSELAGFPIFGVLEDHEGSIWAGAWGVPEGKLCEIRNGKVECATRAGLRVMSLYDDRKANLWVGTEKGVWRWKPGPPQFYPVAQLDGVKSMVDAEDGSLLFPSPGAIRQLHNGNVQLAHEFPVGVRENQSQHIFRDRDGGLWVGTSGSGIVHFHEGRTDLFSPSDGLTGGTVYEFFEDREGNIWVATSGGLDRFRELPVVTYSRNQGLSSRPSGAFLGTADGNVWITSNEGLLRLNDGQVTVYREHSGRSNAGEREVAVRGLPTQGMASLFQDAHRKIWVSTSAGIGYLQNDKFHLTRIPGGVVGAITEDAAGNVWIVNQNLGLFRLSPSNDISRMPWSTLGHEDPGTSAAPDSSQGGLWLGFHQGGLVYFRDGQVRASYSAADGLGKGRVNELHIDEQGALWAATAGGLSRLKDGHIATLSSKNGLPCDGVNWTIEDDAQSVWLMMPCGLARLARSDVDAWAAAPDKARTIRTTVFDNSEGVSTHAGAGGYTPHVAKSKDGRLWFYNTDAVGMIDPRHLPFNAIPPPVAIEQITADRQTYDASANPRLPPLVRDLEIDYTALSFVAPAKNRFRYKLEGHDRDWRDAGNRRQAFYTDLRPRHYRFRVQAANNSGVWNEAGASLDFSVAPAYYQTMWFRASSVAALLLLLAAVYQLRLRYLKRQFNVRMEARVNERTRIARDLHDTMLQSFQGALLKFHAVTYRLLDRPEAKKELETAIEQARAAITEGRQAIEGLRTSTLVVNNLARAITSFGEELAASQTDGNSCEFRVQVEGTTRDLAPLVRDEIYRIAIEALRNAFRHAHARRIEVEIRYHARQLRLRIRDDGRGIDPVVLEEGGRAGHHGLPGMHERARLGGGKLAVWSQPASGTEIELTIPGSLAYAKSAGAAERAVSG